MPRDARAYLADIIDACKAIAEATLNLDVTAYQSSRLVRSSVEREFITIGEALSALSRFEPDAVLHITHSRRIIDFRNRLTHEYPSVDDALVWAIVQNDVPVLLHECTILLEQKEAGSPEN